MNFLNPAFLVGLPLVAVPVLIHLLSRRQQKRISWGAMRFLKAAVTRRRRLWRLTDLLLLLLRTAVFLFFIFALARPLLPSTWLGEAIPREIILVLDQSMSMSRKIGDASFFDLQREKAHALLGQLTTRDSVRVLLAGEWPEWLTPDAIEVSPLTVRKLRAQLDDLQLSAGAADLLAGVREAVDLEEPKDKSARVIVVFSDRQRFGWRLDEQPLWETVQARLRKAVIPTSVSLQLLTETEPETSNLCINRIESLRPFAAVNQSVNFSAHVQNRGPAASAATLLTWRVADQPLGVATIPELAPGASSSVSVAHPFSSVGLASVTARLEVKDALPADNEASLLVEIYERLPVLLVEESNASDPLEKDSTFVLAALGASKASDTPTAWSSVFEPAVLAPDALATANLTGIRCVILANLRQVAPTVLTKLEAYVRAGGGVWIALGANTDTTFFNEQFFRGGLGLSPLKVTSPIGDLDNREKFFGLHTSSEAHPAAALLSDVERLDLDRARVYRRHRFDPFSGKDVSVLLQVQHGDPVVVERKLERGRVLVQSIPLGVSWSTLPLCQAYVAMLHEWLWYLAEPALPTRNLTVGEVLVEGCDRNSRSGVLTLPNNRMIELPPVSSASGLQFHFSGTRLPGEYRLSVPDKEQRATTAKFLVQRNIEESDLTNFTKEDLKQLRSRNGFQLGTGLDMLAAGAKLEAPKHPLEGLLLSSLAVLLLGELLLAGWTTHRRNLRLQPVNMER